MKLSHCGPGLTYMPTSASSNCGKRWIIYFHSVNMDDNNEAKKKKKMLCLSTIMPKSSVHKPMYRLSQLYDPPYYYLCAS